MATKRERNNRWHYVIKRSDLLPKPIYLSFDTEREGDEYTTRLESLLDRGIVPDEVNGGPKKRPVMLIESMRDYLARQHVSIADRDQLRLVAEQLPAGIELRALTFAWASDWATSLKRGRNLAPSTIRHRVGVLARCLDWIAAHSAGETVGPYTGLDYNGNTISPARAVAQTFGIKIRTVALAREQQWQVRRIQSEIAELKGSITKLNRNQSISDSTRESEQDKLRDKIEAARERLQAVQELDVP